MVDTELFLGDLLQHGYEITPDEEDADVIIVNTCGFIGPAKRESIDTILDMVRLKSEGKCKKLVVTGCLSQRYSEDLLKEIPEIDLMLGVNQYPELKNLLLDSDAGLPRNHVHDPWSFYDSYGARVLTTPSHSAYLKIGEGCSFQCAFCSIPEIRGRFRSRSLESLLSETRQLVSQGVKELNLVSQVTNLYGADLKMENGLERLLDSLCKIEGVEWLRLLYCYPSFVNESFLSAIVQQEKVCNYIDVPLQHVHDDMLRAMKRPESEREVRGMIERIRKKIPDVALRTTLISGFPGETEKHFQSLVDFLEETEFDHVGVFVYSDEEGTSAYGYNNKVSIEIAEERRSVLMEIQRRISLQKNEKKVGRTIPVLVESFDKESLLLTGRAAFQAPEIDGQIIIEESNVELGNIVPLKITRALDYDLIGHAAN